MSDPTPGEPELPAPAPASDANPAGPGDDTARMPIEPELPAAEASSAGSEVTPSEEPTVAWDAPPPSPEPARPMPWDAPAAAPPAAAAPMLPGQDVTASDSAVPAGDDPDGGPPPGGVLSAATVGWAAPPPKPAATGNPGWVIAGVGARLGAWLLDGVIGFLLIILGAVVVGIVVAALGMDESAITNEASLIGIIGFYFVYFVGFWTSGSQATPGMRAFNLRVANASDGKRLAIGPAITRWLALGYALYIVSIVPVLSGLASLGVLVWSIVLLITTSQDSMHQGLHDRWAKSVVVRPEGAGSGGGWLTACLIIVLIIGLFFLVSIVALIFLGSQLSEILSAVGESI